MGAGPGPRTFSPPSFSNSPISAATVPTGAAAVATTAVPSPLMNVRRETWGRPVLGGRLLMRGVSHEGCAFAETPLEDGVLAVIDPPQREQWFVGNHFLRDRDRVRRHRGTGRVPERFA